MNHLAVFALALPDRFIIGVAIGIIFCIGLSVVAASMVFFNLERERREGVKRKKNFISPGTKKPGETDLFEG